jgi:EAL domain-containing protein (putative c-di-GMP-specific phosphodiesterase class I)
VRGAVAEVPGGASALDLEITESLLMQDIEANILKLRALRHMGVNIAIDDFGTGYSSLGYLARLPVNALKIDRSFIVTMASSDDSMAIVSTIISLAHSLSLRVIAEGVDSQEQRRLLQMLKCDEIQGYLVSRPAPRDEIARLLGDDAFQA